MKHSVEGPRRLPDEQGRSGIYADDNCDGDFLQVFTDIQGGVYFSMWGTQPRMDLRMVSLDYVDVIPLHFW